MPLRGPPQNHWPSNRPFAPFPSDPVSLMPTHVQEFFESAAAQGFSLEQIFDEARVRLTNAAPSSLLEPSEPDSAETLLSEDSPISHSGALSRAPPSSDAIGLSRYEDLGLLGMGGMGEVRRVRDRLLGRTLAMKIIHALALNRTSLVARFREEAQATAQLQHPGIIPIYDVGRLPDGRLWFTMQEVSGYTFGEVIAEVHDQSEQRWETTSTGWTLHRLVDTLRRACEAVAYAHSRGVLHRDLKPSNIMVGRHGETLILDWGLAKVLGAPTADLAEADIVETVRSKDSEYHTIIGHVAGTPAYMPPEQAKGLGSGLTPQSDVYALGACLYEILSGRPPYAGHSAEAILLQVRNSPPIPLQKATNPFDSIGFGLLPPLRPTTPSGPPIPPALVATCEYAMARMPSERCGNAAELAEELQAWLDGSRQQESARAVMARSSSREPEAQRLRAQAQQLRTEAAALLQGVEPWQSDDMKASAWEKEDKADALCRRADLVALEEELLLQGALTHSPDLVEAHAALANRYRVEHASAEAKREDATRAEALFRQHLLALPSRHPDRRSHITYLEGIGALSLVTDPPGAEVFLEQYTRVRRRLVATPLRSLGRTPLRQVPLPRGSYRLRLRAPGRVETFYPVRIERGSHWTGYAPSETEPRPILLPHQDELGAEDCYVPGGWFEAGGDSMLSMALPTSRVWVDGMLMRRFPVTNREYLFFLNDLLKEGREQEALAWVPRERSGQPEQPGQIIYGRTSEGRFELTPDADGDQWALDWPVMMVDWSCAAAYARWEATRTGRPWGLPGELAWEKAARGVDARIYPWGNYADPSWALSSAGHPGRMLPARIHSHPVDESVYGIRGMAGNIRDWCGGSPLSDGPLATDRCIAPVPARDTDHPLRCLRGGGWGNSSLLLRSSYRYVSDPRLRLDCVGFRLARPV